MVQAKGRLLDHEECRYILNPFSTDTIVALATAAGRAGVAVLRASGPKAPQLMFLACRLPSIPVPRRVTLCDVVDYRNGEILDHALVVWFPAPHSFTGEDVVEFHLHGGRSIIQSTLDVLCSIQGVRPAEPGEFSRRAFEQGKLDLTEAEGIADMVDAETAAQRRQALRQMDGELGRLYHGWAERLAHNLAYIEAEIDFADEEIPPDLAAGRLEDVRALSHEIEAHLNDSHRGERLRSGFTVALMGAPNAGKSSLLNALARREAAIVAPTPGTTRDIIEVQLDLGGYPVTLVDTAGLRESADAIESEGIRRALARAEQADLKLLVFDGTKDSAPDAATLALMDDTALVVINKMDVARPPASQDGAQTNALPDTSPLPDFALAFAAEAGRQNKDAPLPLSAKTGEGLAALTARLVEEIEKRFVAAGQPALTRARHRAALEECCDNLRRALAAPEVELCAEDLRLAIRALGRITGRVDVEDLLDIIFSSFCIGK